MRKEVNLRSQRKNEHVQHALDQKPQNMVSDFDKVHFVHHSMPAVNLDEVVLSAAIGEMKFDAPLYINAMTGGSEWTKSINEKLGKVAAATGIPMAVGSMHAAVRHPELSESYSVVREVNPDGLVFANVGADVSLGGAQMAVEMIDADALQIHLNVAQELIMPEGDRDFKDWQPNIKNILSRVNVPVIVKEVGFGMSRETLQLLKTIGIKYVDVSGRGGTNFAEIENARRRTQDMDYLSGWGMSTVQSLLESKEFQKEMTILASGGIKTPLDAMKSLALGGGAVGMSHTLLKYVAENDVEETIKFVEQFFNQMKKIAVMVNAKNLEELRCKPMVFSPDIISWMEQRNIK